MSEPEQAPPVISILLVGGRYDGAKVTAHPSVDLLHLQDKEASGLVDKDGQPAGEPEVHDYQVTHLMIPDGAYPSWVAIGTPVGVSLAQAVIGVVDFYHHAHRQAQGTIN